MSTLTTHTTDKAWSPDVTTFAPADTVPDALILTLGTKLGTVEGDEPAVRVAYVDDAEADFVPEGDDFDESDPDLDEVLIRTGKVGQLVKISREQYGQQQTAGNLAASVQRAITRKANRAFLAQIAPTPPAVTPPAGLLNITGLTEADGPVTGNLDMLVDLIAELQTNDATPSHIVLDPLGFAKLQKMKVGTGRNDTLLGAGVAAAERRLLGLPVIVANAMTANTGLVVDRAAIVTALGQILVATSEHYYFNSDAIAVRASWRFGQNVVHPDRLGTFTIAEPDDEPVAG